MKASPAPIPREPPMKLKSWTMTTAGSPRMFPKAMAMESCSPVALRADFNRSA